MYSLLDEFASESVADEFNIGKHTKKHDFDNDVKVAAREGIDPSDSVAELEETTGTDADMEKMLPLRSHGTQTTATTTLSSAPCSNYSTFHSCAINVPSSGKRLQRLMRGVVATDATNLELARSVVVSDEFVGDDMQSYKIDSLYEALERLPKSNSRSTVLRSTALRSPTFSRRSNSKFIETYAKVSSGCSLG